MQTVLHVLILQVILIHIYNVTLNSANNPNQGKIMDFDSEKEKEKEKKKKPAHIHLNK